MRDIGMYIYYTSSGQDSFITDIDSGSPRHSGYDSI